MLHCFTIGNNYRKRDVSGNGATSLQRVGSWFRKFNPEDKERLCAKLRKKVMGEPKQPPAHTCPSAVFLERFRGPPGMEKEWKMKR